MLSQLKTKELIKDPDHICKGKIYRGIQNAYIGSKGEYVYQERMIPLKRKSCPGCKKCGYLQDAINDELFNESFPIINDIQDQALYELQIVNESRDYESGMIDDWEIEFVKVKEEKPNG